MIAPVDAKRRRVLFAVAVLILVFGYAAIRVLGGGAAGEHPEPPRPSAFEPGPQARSDATAVAAIAASRSFLGAYLNYQVGSLTEEDRAAIRRLAIPSLRDELLLMPARLAPGVPAPRERILGGAGIDVALEGGEPALRVGFIVAGGGGRRVLTVTLLRRVSGWLVVGVES